MIMGWIKVENFGMLNKLNIKKVAAKNGHPVTLPFSSIYNRQIGLK